MAQLADLFRPGRIGNVEIKNRIIMAPIACCGADIEGYPTPRMIDYLRARADGGVGLIIIGGCFFLPHARPPQQIAIHEDKYIPELKKLTQAVHEGGSKIAMQSNHLGRRMSLSKFAISEQNKQNVISSSAIRQVTDGFIPREATKAQLKDIIEAWSEGCRRAKEAGFDGTEVHGAHGYLLGSFLSPATNKRTDAYGGSPENRARLACEVIESIRRKVGPDFFISMRFSGCDYIHGGITIENTLRQAPMFVEAGADVLHVSASAPETLQYQFLPYLLPDGMIVHLAEAVKKVVTVPVITVGKLGNPVLANRAIKQNKADFVAMARPLLADPELPNKSQNGRLADITRCLYCNACCAMPREERRKFGGLRCTVNPALFREREFKLTLAPSPKKVMVVGGGIAGLEAARTLAERGHKVFLYERNIKLGGQWNIVAQQRLKKFYNSLTKQLTRRLKNTNAKIILNEEVTPQLVDGVKPDVIILATGGRPELPDIQGIENEIIVHVNDVITGKVEVGDKVVIIGGQIIGLEIAASLAEQGKKVSIISRDKIGSGSQFHPDTNTMRVLLDSFVEHGVSIYSHSDVYEIKENGVYIDYDQQVLFGLLFIRADTVVVVGGIQPDNVLEKKLKGHVGEIYKIGDCINPRSAMETMKDAAEIARLI